MGLAGIDTAVAGWFSAVALVGLCTAPALAMFHAGARSGRILRVALVRSLAAVPLLAVEGWMVRQALGVVPFRLAFALVLPALVASICADRMKFVSFAAFVGAWSVAVLAPVAHWVWGRGGWLAKMGVLDFAGGAVVHLTAGVAVLVCTRVLGRSEDGFDPDDLEATGPKASAVIGRGPASAALLPLAGAALLWAAYSACNGAAGLPSVNLASLALARTELAAVAGGLGWLLVQWRDRGRFDRAGVASGVVAGLVAIAPAAGYVSSSAAFAIGFIGGVVSYGTVLGALAGLSAALLAITADAGYVAPVTAVALAAGAGGFCFGVVLLHERFGHARFPTAFGTHAVAGLAGALLTGVFAQKALNGQGANGALYGHTEQAAIQLAGCAAIATYAAAMTYVLLKILDATIGLRYGAEPARVIDDRNDGCEVTGVRERRPRPARIASL